MNGQPVHDLFLYYLIKYVFLCYSFYHFCHHTNIVEANYDSNPILGTETIEAEYFLEAELGNVTFYDPQY